LRTERKIPNNDSFRMAKYLNTGLRDDTTAAGSKNVEQMSPILALKKNNKSGGTTRNLTNNIDSALNSSPSNETGKARSNRLHSVSGVIVSSSSCSAMAKKKSSLKSVDYSSENYYKISGNGTETSANNKLSAGNLYYKDSIKSSEKRATRMNKQEKAFKQLAAIVIGFTLCFLPYFVVYLIIAICNECVSNEIFTFTVWLGYLNSTINPFLYALSNKRFFKSSKRVAYKNNKENNNNANKNNNNANKNNNNRNNKNVLKNFTASQHQISSYVRTSVTATRSSFKQKQNNSSSAINSTYYV
jgi:hypothetical protein